MTFEERLLAELRAEAAARGASAAPARRPRLTGRRMLTAIAIAGVCMGMEVVGPAVTGSRADAYTMTRNVDGSITVTISELRDPDRLETALAANGARTDITYLPQHMRCDSMRRGVPVDPQPPDDVWKDETRLTRWIAVHRPLPTDRAFQWPSPRNAPNVFRIVPAHIGRGQTLVLELGESHRTRLWKLSSFLVSGPVKPCVLENDPLWN
jgi:hypothetical protein